MSTKETVKDLIVETFTKSYLFCISVFKVTNLNYHTVNPYQRLLGPTFNALFIPYSLYSLVRSQQTCPITAIISVITESS